MNLHMLRVGVELTQRLMKFSLQEKIPRAEIVTQLILPYFKTKVVLIQVQTQVIAAVGCQVLLVNLICNKGQLKFLNVFQASISTS